MVDRLHDELLATTAEALETLAFIAALPPELPVAPKAPEAPILCSIAFDGSVAGRLEMVMPLAFAQGMASTLLGTDPCDADAAERAADCAKEVMNVVCGSLLRKLPDELVSGVQLGLPTMSRIDAPGWDALATDPVTTTLDADGMPLAVRLTMAA
jgi:hypothetical protein